jgi:spatacsin
MMPQASNKQFMFNPLNNDEFFELMKIFGKNCSLFGLKLLEKSKKLLVDAKTSDEFVIMTELLVRAHDCFNQSCSMEGISNILQISKLCANKLEKAREFNIMVNKVFILAK